MILSKGKLLVDSFRPCTALANLRFASSLPSVETPQKSSPVPKTKEKREPFVKNFFLGVVEDDFLQFTSARTFNLPDQLDKIAQLYRSNSDNLNPLEKLKILAKNGFFNFSCRDLNKNGISQSDILHLYEVLDLDPSTSTLLEMHSSIIIPVLSNNASPEQNDLYVEKLLKGEITGAYALTEEGGGCDPTSVTFTCEEDNEYFILNGEKLWITNALNADFFLVLGRTPLDNLKRGETPVAPLSAFIVNKNSNIEIEKHNLVGLNDCGIAKIKVNNLSIHSNNMIGPEDFGYKIASEGLKSPKFIQLVCVLNNLKRVIADTSRHICGRKQMLRDLKENEIIKKKLTGIMSTVYCFESMLYFTSDILDRYEIDTSLESALLQIYGFENCLSALKDCLELLGAKAYDNSFPYFKILNDLNGFSLINATQVTRMYASLIGFEYAGNRIKDIVRKNRNPLNFPGHVFKRMIQTRGFFSDNLKLTLKLYRNYHPSLKDAAEKMEYSLLKFHFVVEALLSRYGAELVFRTIDLNRVADTALELFSMASVLTRASHSYCTGVEFSEVEVHMANRICYESFHRCKETMHRLMAEEAKSSDNLAMKIALRTINKQSYFLRHPLEHDI